MSKPTKISAADYAQNRRNNEKTTTEGLRALIPKEYFREEVEMNGNYNLSTKAMKAAEYYIQALAQEKLEEEATTQPGSPVGSTKGKGTPGSNKKKGKGKAGAAGFSNSDYERQSISSIEEINQLRQCVRRLIAKSEEKASAAGPDGMSEELTKSIEKGSDLCIDLLKVIEQEGWSQEMKEKWEKEYEGWVGK